MPLRIEKPLEPLIDVIVPHLPDRKMLCMNSLDKQTFKNFNVIVEVDKNGEGAPKMRNKGASLGSAEFIFFCDDDIELKEDCLEKMLREIVDGVCDFVYCDYEKAGELSGIEYGQPWDYEKLKERNYVSTMSLVRRSSFPEKGFDESLVRYQDWDLWLTMGERGKVGRYINEILFKANFGKSGISMAGPESRIENTKIIKQKHNINSYEYNIIIPVKNQIDYAKRCLNSVVKCTPGSYQIIVIDDGSTDKILIKYLNILREKNQIILIRHNKSVGHTKACNIGVEACNGTYVCLLNSDTIVTPNWNTKLSAMLSDDRILCCGPMTSYAASVQEVSFIKKRRFDFKALRDIVKIEESTVTRLGDESFIAKVTGFCMVIRRENWNKLNGFDESIPDAGNEADFLIRGLKNNMYPMIRTGCYVHHYGRMSYGYTEETKKKWREGSEKVEFKHGKHWLSILEKDLYLNLINKVFNK